MRTSGAAGHSGIDDRGWRRLCTSFHSASGELCVAMSSFARRLCTVFLSPDLLSPFLVCRLIALDKSPGVWPIGVCEVMRRIVAKAVLVILRDDIQEAAGSHKLCAGQLSGAEAAVHAVRKVSEEGSTEAVLLVDVYNAFNSPNRLVALHNIRQLCPPLSTILINIYRSPASLLVPGEVILSEEGTTQGDPLAMPMYALATVPLIKVDAYNAFNSPNRLVALHNIRQLCPPLSTILINIYRSPASLLVPGEVILSEEGTTQGDPLAMPMYALATVPLINQLHGTVDQVWYADDACACGSIQDLLIWWNQLCIKGPAFGYL